MAVRARRARGDAETALKEAAAALFAQQGYAGATLDRIAEASGVNKAMVAYYFGDKAGLYAAVLEGGVDAVLAHVEARVSETAPPAERLESFIEALADAFAANPYFPRVLLQEYLAGGGAQTAMRPAKKLAELLAQTTRILEAGAVDGAFRPADPHMTHLSLVGALMFFDLTAPFRHSMQDKEEWKVSTPQRTAFVAHLKTLFARGLASE